jgi:hypothetical protein
MSDTISTVKTAFIGGGIAFIATVTVILVSLFAGAAWASALAGFPFTLVMFLIAATIVNKKKEQINFDRFLMLSTILYFVMFLVILIWWVLSYYAFQNLSWVKRLWSTFGIAIILWIVAVITLLVTYYTNSRWKNYLNPKTVFI